MTRALRLLPALLVLLPGLAQAQLRSGPDAPAVGSQLPPSTTPEPMPQPPRPAPPRDAPARTAPPEGHRTLAPPPVPGATRPEASEGATTSRDRIPEDIGRRVRPDASTTGR